MNTSILRILTIAGLGLCSNIIYAAHVLPEFSGDWFTAVTYTGMDACGNSSFSYTNRIQGNAASVGQQLLNDVPPRSDCEWSPAAKTRDVPIGTSDFVGSDKDWKLIYSDQSKPHTEVWGRSCKDKQGRLLDGRSVSIQPAYICPTGSQRSFNIPDGEIGCTTTPAACRADVMGRDLNLGGFGDLGHIALAQPGFTSGMVLEVLKTPQEGIYTNSMQSFKNFPNSPYWGDKMGLPGIPILSMDDANKIINAGVAQTRYPFEYTLTWDWHPGGMSSQLVLNQQSRSFEKVLAGTSAKFRCDSFVYYTYLAGANLHIVPDFGMPDVPKTLFSAMQSCRDHEGKYCGTADKFNLARSFTPKRTLAAVFNDKDIDIHLVDNTMKEFVQDPAMPRFAKLNYLWSLASQYTNDENRYGYIVDSLSYLRPLELIPEMINAFNNSTNVASQRKLIGAIIASLQQDDITELNRQMNNVIQAQNFIRDVLLNNRQPEILRFVVQIYPSVMPPDQAEKDITLFFKREDVPGIQNLMTKKEKVLLNLRMDFATPQRQSTQLVTLIEQNQNDDTFKHALCFMINSVPLLTITQDVKLPAQKYLAAVKTTLAKADDNSDTCDWLSAYAAVTVNNEAQKDEFMLNYIRHESDGETRAKFIANLPKQVFAKIANTERRQYQAEMQKLLMTKPADKVSVENALSRVSGR